MSNAFEPEAFGRYFLVDKIAVGGMAEVFKAKSFSTGGFEKLLVIKRILGHLSNNDEFISMFIDEARISVELQHPNLVQVYDFGKLRDNYFIAMECVEGKDVKSILRKLAERRKLLPTEFAVYIAHETAKGLDYAHKKTNIKGEPLGIVHRDISPSNILLSYEGDVKIADFGIAKAEIGVYDTKDGVLKGKFEYMSPEQASGTRVSARSDIFAAGIILHEMLTGRRLFKTDSDLKTLEKVKTVDIKAPSEVNPAVPVRLDQIVMRALQQDPDNRYEDAKSFQQALLEFMYPSTPDLTRESLGHFLREIFLEEITDERNRLEEGSRVAIQMYESEPEIELDEDWEPRATGNTGTLNVAPSRAPLLIGGAFVVLALLGVIGFLAWTLSQEPTTVVVEKEVDKSPTVGAVQLRIVPDEAEVKVFLGDAMISEQHAFLYEQVPPEEDLELRVEAPGFQPWSETVHVAAGERLMSRVTLTPLPSNEPPHTDVGPRVQPPPGPEPRNSPSTDQPATKSASASISSNPSGADVYVDGSLVGRTPMTWQGARAGGSYAIELRKDGYESARGSASLPDEGGSTSFSRTLKPVASEPGKVSVNIKSGWAEVWIDGKKIDTTPLFNHSLSAGSHTIRVVNEPAGIDESRTVTVTAGETNKVNF